MREYAAKRTENGSGCIFSGNDELYSLNLSSCSFCHRISFDLICFVITIVFFAAKLMCTFGMYAQTDCRLFPTSSVLLSTVHLSEYVWRAIFNDCVCVCVFVITMNASIFVLGNTIEAKCELVSHTIRSFLLFLFLFLLLFLHNFLS